MALLFYFKNMPKKDNLKYEGYVPYLWIMNSAFNELGK
ncbi:hypothetical protein FBY51_1272 [Zymomonas mobilis]|nr:hypothetical protein ZZ6_0093 [Zymomonas mobilis subsp. mobilis ATCC 29191]TQK78571.1 hypothetical protein FBY53_1257 [Zymomonas mobilis]TQL16224.1 hypothetical protein FBY51_1272 [Zymomonas mobilis]